LVERFAILGATVALVFLISGSATPSMNFDDATSFAPTRSKPRVSQESEMVLRNVVTLSAAEFDGEFPDSAFLLAQGVSGRFFTTTRSRDALVVFGEDGRFEAVVGGRGTDPGEFLRITSLIPLPDGAIAAYDVQLRRLTIVGPEQSVTSTVSTEYRPIFLHETGDSYIAAQQVLTPERVGLPIHLIDFAGGVLNSFGANQDEMFRADNPMAGARVVAEGPHGSVWSARPDRYVIERWDPLTGARLQQLVVDADWFAESTDSSSGPQSRPKPLIEGLWEHDGYLWALHRVPDANWERATPFTAEQPFDLEQYNGMFDWVLEAIDPGTGNVLAHRRFQSVLWKSMQSPLIVSEARPAAEGSRRVSVWRAVLLHKPQHKERAP
jgi:hypothetical protein